nr:hypothetical protein CFP56_20757 [Quercus suber]
MQKAENLILQSKTAIVDFVKHELSSGFKPIGLVLEPVIGIDSHMSGRRLEEKVTNVHEIVTMLLGNVTNVHEIVTVLSGNVTNVHSNLGDEIAKLTVEVSKLSMLIFKEPPNPEVGRKMDAILAATNKLVFKVTVGGICLRIGSVSVVGGALGCWQVSFLLWCFSLPVLGAGLFLTLYYFLLPTCCVPFSLSCFIELRSIFGNCIIMAAAPIINLRLVIYVVIGYGLSHPVITLLDKWAAVHRVYHMKGEAVKSMTLGELAKDLSAGGGIWSELPELKKD